MRLGVCTSLEHIGLLEKSGYDYIELGLASLEALAEKDFRELRRRVENSSIKAEAFNGFFPANIRLVGDAVDRQKIQDYLDKMVERAAQLGGKIIVFGSGAARAVPEGFSKERAFEQLVDFLRLADPVAERYGITIAIEPLRVQECNIINTVREGLALAKAVDRPHIRLLADTYHMAFQQEGMDAIVEAGREYIFHIHVANPDGRVYPKLGDGVDYGALFDALKEIGYQGRVSIEASTKDLAKDIKDAMALWKSLL
ncbi:MAG: sugar phosphate isomerase/epimerase family protein [Clostridia bacterium]